MHSKTLVIWILLAFFTTLFLGAGSAGDWRSFNAFVPVGFVMLALAIGFHAGVADARFERTSKR